MLNVQHPYRGFMDGYSQTYYTLTADWCKTYCMLIKYTHKHYYMHVFQHILWGFDFYKQVSDILYLCLSVSADKMEIVKGSLAMI